MMFSNPNAPGLYCFYPLSRFRIHPDIKRVAHGVYLGLNGSDWWLVNPDLVGVPPTRGRALSA